MEGQDPARPPPSAYESLAEYTFRMYRSYQPYEGEGILRIVCRFYELWERTHQYGTSELHGIHQLISRPKRRWGISVASCLSSSCQYVHYLDIPPIAEGDLPPPPLQWSVSISSEGGTWGRYDHEAGSSRQPSTDLPPGTSRQPGMRRPDGARRDPEGRGKAPMIATDEEEGLGEPQMDHTVLAHERAPEREGQMSEVHVSHFLRV